MLLSILGSLSARWHSRVRLCRLNSTETVSPYVTECSRSVWLTVQSLARVLVEHILASNQDHDPTSSSSANFIDAGHNDDEIFAGRGGRSRLCPRYQLGLGI